jgi:hypothetical protein
MIGTAASSTPNKSGPGRLMEVLEGEEVAVAAVSATSLKTPKD